MSPSDRGAGPARTGGARAAGRRGRGAKRAALAAPVRVHAPAPRTARDPWAWASVLAIVPLLARCIGAPLGEAVAEDFDFLHRTLFSGMGSLLDGGGSTAFWRPVAHQLYYAALGPVIVGSPRVVAALHVLLLAAGGLLVYRTLRPHMSGFAAFAAATFPMFSESTRTLVSWPSQFVDVGLYFFSALALREASRRRLPTALAAALIALFCKEVGVVTLLMLPWLPSVLDRPERRRWLLGSGAVLALWATAYVAVRNSAHLALPHGIEHEAAGAPWQTRIAWALNGSVRALGSLALKPGAGDTAALVVFASLVAVVAFAVIASPAVRVRFAARRGWIGWGLAWFTLATATLVPIHPLWQPNRSQFGATGAGIVAALSLEAVHPAAAGALVLGRLGLLLMSPPAATTISEAAPETGAFMDFVHLSRLQRFMNETRSELARRYPSAAQHSNLMVMNLPRSLSYALGGDRAAQVWYRDTTLRTVSFTRLVADSALPMIAAVQYQPRGNPQIVLVSPDAMRAQDQGFRHIRAQRWGAGIQSLARADSLEPDASLTVFHGNNAGYRSLALLQLGRFTEAEREARRALTLYDRDDNARRVLGLVLIQLGRLDEAEAHVLRMERAYGDVPWVQDLRARLAAARLGTTRR